MQRLKGYSTASEKAQALEKWRAQCVRCASVPSDKQGQELRQLRLAWAEACFNDAGDVELATVCLQTLNQSKEVICRGPCVDLMIKLVDTQLGPDGMDALQSGAQEAVSASVAAVGAARWLPFR